MTWRIANVEWQIVLTPEFKKVIKKLKKNKAIKKKADNAVKDIILDPYHNSSIFKERKIMKRRFGDYRMFYQVCEDCKLRKVDHIIQCADCDDIPENAVVFFDFRHKKDSYK